MRTIAAALFAALLAVASAAAEEKAIDLKAAPGVDKVEGHCAACHSLDYIEMNSPFLSPAGWDAEVTKMIKTFGAPIDAADAEVIADYLKANYGG
jgi:sulfite dehydrogenase (cytochrome) subunit B